MITNIRLANGEVIEEEKIRHLVNKILKIFADCQMSYEEAKIVLEFATEELGFRSKVLTFL